MKTPFTRFALVSLSIALLLGLLAAALRPSPYAALAGPDQPAGGVIAIAAGDYHTCALTGVGGVKCWGNNTHGELGDGTTTNRLTPVDVSGLTSGVVAIASGRYHTCAVTTAGGVLCWGWNPDGRLGDGSTTDRLVPVPVSGLASGVARIAAGDRHTCALTTAGGVKCWGDNSDGQLGDGTTTPHLTPVDVGDLLSGVTAIAAGDSHTCALQSGGVKCWGRNDDGQLGDGTTVSRLAPVAVSGLASGVSAIAAGYYHTCALAAGGSPVCWGWNEQGQLGDGTSTSSSSPVGVYGLESGVTAITAGWGHTCALTAAGGGKCWGSNGKGRLGDGTTTDRLTPVDVSGLSSGIAAITAGGYHTCARMDEGRGGVKCWGFNYAGQLGNGSTEDSSIPLDVTGLGESTVTPTPTQTGAPGPQAVVYLPLAMRAQSGPVDATPTPTATGPAPSPTPTPTGTPAPVVPRAGTWSGSTNQGASYYLAFDVQPGGASLDSQQIAIDFGGQCGVYRQNFAFVDYTTAIQNGAFTFNVSTFSQQFTISGTFHDSGHASGTFSASVTRPPTINPPTLSCTYSRSGTWTAVGP